MEETVKSTRTASVLGKLEQSPFQATGGNLGGQNAPPNIIENRQKSHAMDCNITQEVMAASLPSEILLKILSHLSLEQLLPCQTVSRRFRKLSRTTLIDKLTNTTSHIPSLASRVRQNQLSIIHHHTSDHLQESRVNIESELVLFLFQDYDRTPRHWEECQHVRFVCIGADRESEWLVFTPVADPYVRIHLASGQTAAVALSQSFSGIGLAPKSSYLYHAPAIGLDIFDYASGQRRIPSDLRQGTEHIPNLVYSRPLGSLMSVEPSMPRTSRRDQDRYSVIGIRHGCWSSDEQTGEMWGEVEDTMRSMLSLPWPSPREPGIVSGRLGNKGSGVGHSIHRHTIHTKNHSTRYPPYYTCLCLHHDHQLQPMDIDDSDINDRPLCDTSQCSLNPFPSGAGSTHISVAYEASLVESEECAYCQARPCRSQKIQVEWHQVRVSLDWILAGLVAPSPEKTETKARARTRARTPEKDAR